MECVEALIDGSIPSIPSVSQMEMRYEEAVRDVRNSRLVDCRYKYAENPHKAGQRSGFFLVFLYKTYGASQVQRSGSIPLVGAALANKVPTVFLIF